MGQKRNPLLHTGVFINENEHILVSIVYGLLIFILSIIPFFIVYTIVKSIGRRFILLYLPIGLFMILFGPWFDKQIEKREEEDWTVTRLQAVKSAFREEYVTAILRGLPSVVVFILLYDSIPVLPPILTRLFALVYALLALGLVFSYFEEREYHENAFNLAFLGVALVFLYFVFSDMIFQTENITRLSQYVEYIRSSSQAHLQGITLKDSNSVSIGTEMRPRIIFNTMYALIIAAIVIFNRAWSAVVFWLSRGQSSLFSMILRIILPKAIIYNDYNKSHGTYPTKVRINTSNTVIEWAKWVISILILLPPILVFIDYLVIPSSYAHSSSVIAALTMAAVLFQTINILVLEPLNPYEIPPWLEIKGQ